MRSDNLRNDDAVATLQGALRELERCGCGRPVAASLSEYLAAFVDAQLLPKEHAELALSVYNGHRYGRQTIFDHRLEDSLENLRSAVRKLESLDPDRRAQFAEQLRRRFTPPEPRIRREQAALIPVKTTTAASPAGTATASSRIVPPPLEFDPLPLEADESRAIPASETSQWLRRRYVLAGGIAVLLWSVAIVAAGYVWHADLRAVVAETRFRLGWEDSREMQTSWRDSGVTANRPSSTSDVEILMQRASILDNAKQTQLAINTYDVILQLEPNHAMATNNLAWLLLTTEDAAYHNTERALMLAKAAVRLDPSYVNLDTLAEAWFQNGDPAKAVELEEQTLELAEKHQPKGVRDQRPFFRRQLEKFRKGASNPSQPPASVSSPVEASPETPVTSRQPEPPPLPE